MWLQKPSPLPPVCTAIGSYLHDLLHWEFGGCGTSQDFVDIGGDLLPSTPPTWAIAHETPRLDCRTRLAHRGQTPLDCEVSNLALQGAKGGLP